MFYNAAAFNQDIGAWDVSNVANMYRMFDGATAFSQNLGRWYITSSMFPSNTPILTTQNRSLREHSPLYALVAGTGDTHNDLFTLDGSILTPNTGIAEGFYSIRVHATGSALFGTANQHNLSITLGAPPFSFTFSNFITTWQMGAGETLTFPSSSSSPYVIYWGDGTFEFVTSSNPTHRYSSARNYTVITSDAITRFNLNNHADAGKLIAVEQWGSASWSSMENAFFGASAMTITAVDVPDLSGVSSTQKMFQEARLLNPTSIRNWDVGNVRNMNSMFNNAATFNQNISGWDVSKVTDMVNILQGGTAFKQNLGR